MKELQTFACSEQTFTEIKEKWLRLLQNATVSEPYYRLTEVAGSLIKLGEGSINENLSYLVPFTYERFMEMKQNWMKNLVFEWLVQGHITKQDAWELVDRTCECITGYKEITKPHEQKAHLVLLPNHLLNHTQ